MNKNLLLLSLSLLTMRLCAQNTSRRVNFHSIGRDSVNLPFNADYYLIEDSCALITRYGHYDFTGRTFKGKFTDVSTAKPTVTVGEGFYTTDGFKNGLFTTYYLNGNLQAKGMFKDDKYNGHWEIYHEDGRPEVTFEATDSITRITDAWDEKGKKTVDKGAGSYTYKIGNAYWAGKLLNGTPDGTWRLINNDDVTGAVLATEHFKKGKFQNGSTSFADYTGKSHMNLNVPLILPLVNAEKMYVSLVACNGTGFKHIVGAQYREGPDAFQLYINKAVAPYFSKMNLSGIDVTFTINGEISEKGELTNLKVGDQGDIGVFRRIIVELAGMPPLQPATVDGKPVKQKFSIFFKVSQGYYQYSYSFIPIKVN